MTKRFRNDTPEITKRLRANLNVTEKKLIKIVEIK